MKIALAQINTTVGDFEGNRSLIEKAYLQGGGAGVELVVTPELAITGYPPRDLLLKSGFIEANLAVLEDLAGAVGKVGLVVGHVGLNESHTGRRATNAVSLLHQGKIVATRTKTLLPTYDVFDEDRYFEPANENTPVEYNGRKLGLTICEDVWNDEVFWKDRRYEGNPVDELVEQGADIIINISASPWSLGKERMRCEMLSSLAAKIKRPVIYCNAGGGNDELVFDGGSLGLNIEGKVLGAGIHFSEDLVVVDLEKEPQDISESQSMTLLYDALVLGVRDYLGKCGFKSAIIGLSGGIDSAVTAVIAAAALGSENVRGISMPSQYSSQGSLDDSRALADNLGIQYDVISIKKVF